MKHHRHWLWTHCTSQNVYDPARALSQAFFPAIAARPRLPTLLHNTRASPSNNVPSLAQRRWSHDVRASRTTKARSLDTDVVFNNLEETLDAHRNTNQEAIVRRVRGHLGRNRAARDVARHMWETEKTRENRERRKIQRDNARQGKARELDDDVRKIETGMPEAVVAPKGAVGMVVTDEPEAVVAPTNIVREVDTGVPKAAQALKVYFTKHLKIAEEGSIVESGYVLTPQTLVQQMDLLRTKRKSTKFARPGNRFPPNILEYTGLPVLPITDKLSQLAWEGDVPWVTRKSRSLQGMDRLQVEIDTFAAWMQPTPAETAARNAVVSEVTAHCMAAVPALRIEIFGSQSTGLATATSDIDFGCSKVSTVDASDDLVEEPAPEVGPESRFPELAGVLKKLYLAMQASPVFSSTELRKAKKALVASQHRETGLDVQIVKEPDAGRSQEHVRLYLSEHPSLHALFVLVKTALEVRGLTNVWKGGLGSYSIFMMIVASLKRTAANRKTPILRPKSGARSSHATAQEFLDFLDFYADHDYHHFGITVDPPTLFAKWSGHWPSEVWEDGRDKDRPVTLMGAEAEEVQESEYRRVLIGRLVRLQPYMLCLQDPAQGTNDLGGKAGAIKHVVATFSDLRRRLRRAMEESLNTTAPSRTFVRLSDVGSGRDTKAVDDGLLGIVLGSCYTTIDERRARIEAFGLKVLEEKAKREGEDGTGDGRAEHGSHNGV
ncbi:hypothetical protein LTR50_001813 [Elasticomyces elasticus]|nr:hypothetical protein LTR50_001813 [Elasticomyces elasticus]